LFEKNVTPCRYAAVPLKGDKFGVHDELINIQRINPSLGGEMGADGVLENNII
jgi:hypothetical protein